MVPFESLSRVSYSHSTATMAVSLAVCEIAYPASKMAWPWKLV